MTNRALRAMQQQQQQRCADDFHGLHLRKITEGQVMGEYKQEVTKKIVLGVIDR